MKKYVIAILLWSFCFSANALEYPAPFKIKSIFMSQPNNFYFRVSADYTDPNAWHCDSGPKNPAWSYIDETDPGSKAMIAALLTAYSLGKTVTLITVGVDTYAGRMCKIIEFSIQD